MLKISNLVVSIDQKPVINGLSLTMEPGTVQALMGPNGSGKSSLAFTLMGHPHYTIIHGTISYNGEDITHMVPDKRAKLGIFLAFQNPLEVPGVKVATFLKEAHHAVTGQHLSVTDFNALLHDTLALLGLDPSFAYRNLNEGFSGGEKKRLELLQMIILNPSLIILDEIDSGLDIDALQLVATALNKLKQNNPQLSIIVITHYQRILSFLKPDYVHIVANGTIIKSGDSALALELENKGYHGAICN